MDENTPLLNGYRDEEEQAGNDVHTQYCMLIGMKPSGPDKIVKQPTVGKSTLYGRVTRKRRHQNWVYMFTSSLSNTLLLTQVVLGAALTGLGASESSHILITVFGALNTVIAGLVAYLKSRGQPMRAKMFRDDLDRVVDEIENSEVMWLGISQKVHGYDEIAIDDSVSVRSEVARLTRLYDKAVRGNTANDPDMYQASTHETGSAMLRSRPGQLSVPLPVPPAAPPAAPGNAGSAPAAGIEQPVIVTDPDESGPASAPSKSKDEPAKAESPSDQPNKDDTPKDGPKDASDDTAKGDTTAGAEAGAPAGSSGGQEAQHPDESTKDSAGASKDAAVDGDPTGNTEANNGTNANLGADAALEGDKVVSNHDEEPATKK